MRPSTRLAPDVDDAREAYDAAFATACRYSGGRDLVEEMVAAHFWSLRREGRPKMTLERVKLPMFKEAEGILFPHFGLKLAKGEDGANIAAQVEATASEILGDISECEYLAR